MENGTHKTASLIGPPQPMTEEERQKVLALLKTLGEDWDEQDQKESFIFLKKALDENRPEGRKLFQENE
jgi:hypothetical protein